MRDGETGTLFRAGDAAALAQAIERLLADRAQWEAMRVRARRHVEAERNWTRSVARTNRCTSGRQHSGQVLECRRGALRG